MRTKERVLDSNLEVVVDSINHILEKGLRQDRFNLNDNDLGVDVKAIEVTYPSKTNKLYPYFKVQTSAGKMVSIPSSLAINGRVMMISVPPSKLKTLDGTKHCFIGDSYPIITDNSQLFHDYYGIEKDKNFFFPKNIKLFGALISCDRDGNPKPSLYSYELYREYYRHCADNGLKHSLDLFQVELNKTGKERLSFLPNSMKQPKLHDYLVGKLRPSDYSFTLLFMDIED
jgi:hypothetical protein